MVSAQVYTVAKIFDGDIKVSDFTLITEELPSLEDGEYLVECLYLSVDPYMRMHAKNYTIGQVMIGIQVAKVIETKDPSVPVGQVIVGNLGWRTHTIIKPSHSYIMYVLPDIGTLPTSLALGVLGATGISAYFGFLEICKPLEGETVVVSGAGGAVGSHVGQIAKIKGCRVVGITGSEEKKLWLEKIGFDYVINYKATENLAEELQIAAPDGVDCYFDNIHQLMLKDVPRNRAYKQAIFDNKDQFKGRVVLDLGAGTGILSIFCAQVGAAKIYAVEASDVYKIAEEVVKENGFEGVVKVIHSRIEDVTLSEKVDIIVSEWMGFYLLHEGMLDSLITARDRFLKPGGLIFPESATLYSAPCCVPDMYDLWDDVEGVTMNCFGEKLRSEASHKPITSLVSPEDVLSDPEIVLWIDLREVTLEEISNVKIQHVAVANRVAKYQGICLWFCCLFPSFLTEPVTLSTSPEDPETHWKQTTIVLPTEVDVEEKWPIAYELSLARSSENNRRYNIEVTMLDPEEIQHPEYCGCHLTKCILVRAMLEKYEEESLPK